MTKLRTPLTFADAMTRVAGTIGWAEASAIADRADRTLRLWSDPDSTATPPISIALDLDAAYRKAGGEGVPFQEAYDFQLDMVIERQDACRQALSAEIATLAAEVGQAIAAAMQLLRRAASPRDAHRAFAEVTDTVDALAALQRRIASFLPSDVASGAGNDGGTHA